MKTFLSVGLLAGGLLVAPTPRQAMAGDAAGFETASATIHHADTVGGIFRGLRAAVPGDQIVLAPGTYKLDTCIHLNTPGITLRGATGNRDDVVLQGPGMNVEAHPMEGIAINTDDITISDLTVAGFWWNGIHIRGENDADRTRIRNVKTLNCGERHIKGSRGGTYTVDDVVIEDLYMLQTEPRLSRPGHSVDPNDYIGGIDCMVVDSWLIRDVVAEGIRGASGGSRGAIFLWNGVHNTTIERVRIFDCGTGIAIGNPSGPTNSSTPPWHAEGVLIRNCFLRRGTGIALELCNVKDVKVYNNTIYSDNADYFRTLHVLDYGGRNTNIDLRNNIIRGRTLDNSSGDWSDAAVAAMGNLVDTTGHTVTADWFANVACADFHLTTAAVPAVDAAAVLADVPEDFDRQGRGSLPDFGADEYCRPGDANGDGLVDVVDLLILAMAFASSEAMPGYDRRADFNGDGAINGADLLILAQSFDT